MRERFGASDASCRLRFHTQTGGVTLTAQQPLNNVVRVTVQTLAATLGGTQSLHTNGYDEALSLPTAEAATLALRTQQIVAYESGIAGTVDPLAGSYYVEALTDALEREAMALLEKVDALGGAERAIAAGFFQDEIARSAYEHQLRVESRRDGGGGRESVWRRCRSADHSLARLLGARARAGRAGRAGARVARRGTACTRARTAVGGRGGVRGRE